MMTQYRTEGPASEVAGHFHNGERWLGKRAVQTATEWGTPDVITPFQAISGANTWGTDPDDEAQVIGTADTKIIEGTYEYDPHRIFMVSSDSDTTWKLRLIWGATTMAAAITAHQYSEVPFLFDPLTPIQSAGIPSDVKVPLLRSGTDQLWVQGWNATDNATIDFLVGVHEYPAMRAVMS